MYQRFVLAAVLAVVLLVGLSAQTAGTRGGVSSIRKEPLQEWLTYLASDELQGREVYTEGLGLAAAYIAGHLKAWGLKPAAGDGTYFQTVKVLGVRNTGRSRVTVDVKGQRRTFVDGEGISLPRNAGGRQTFTAGDVTVVGYGLQLPDAGIDDYAGLEAGGTVVVWLGAAGPKGAKPLSPRLLAARSRLAVEKGAAAVIAPPSAGGRGGRGGGGRGGAQPEGARGAQADFVTVQRYDQPVTPVVTAQREFLEFLFSGGPVPYAELEARAAAQEPLPRLSLHDVTLTFDLEPEYSVVSTRLSRNVVAIVEGTDPRLKDTYVAFGAHYDHIGYQDTTAPQAGGGQNAGGCTGQSRRDPRPGDIVHNGADDDGTGTVALMAIARAFAAGPRPRRSLVFVWHTGEESGLQGSRYNAEYPVVPNDRVVAQLNLDMVGRNRCDDPAEENTVYLVGSDRISTDLHNLSEDANASLSRPMTLDYELNDPADPQSIYTRSDHYSYAAKGIPIIFYTTGLHRDYHALTDEVERIEFDKLARVAQLVYTTGRQLANAERAPVRDNRGPRVGKGTRGKLEDR